MLEEHYEEFLIGIKDLPAHTLAQSSRLNILLLNMRQSIYSSFEGGVLKACGLLCRTFSPIFSVLHTVVVNLKLTEKGS